MKNLLIINSSPRTTRSHTRRLTDLFTSYWIKHNPDASVIYRDLGLEHVPHISENWIAGAFKAKELRDIKEQASLAKSDEYIEELRIADVIVLGVPMYNYSIPSSLKAYLDQVIRVNETWILNRENLEDPYIGLLKGKRLVVLTSRGAEGYEKGGYNECVNFQSTYLKAAFKMIGLTNVQEIAVNGELSGGDNLVKAFENAQQKIQLLVDRMVISGVK